MPAGRRAGERAALSGWKRARQGPRGPHRKRAGRCAVADNTSAAGPRNADGDRAGRGRHPGRDQGFHKDWVPHAGRLMRSGARRLTRHCVGRAAAPGLDGVPSGSFRAGRTGPSPGRRRSADGRTQGLRRRLRPNLKQSESVGKSSAVGQAGASGTAPAQGRLEPLFPAQADARDGARNLFLRRFEIDGEHVETAEDSCRDDPSEDEESNQTGHFGSTAPWLLCVGGWWRHYDPICSHPKNRRKTACGLCPAIRRKSGYEACEGRQWC